jgi:hypothetical protein
MPKETGNYYALLYAALLSVAVLGLITAEPVTTGFVVREVQDTNSFFDVDTFEGDPRVCADSTSNGECSSLIKPNFCVYGTLTDYCELCGCDAGETCSNHECVRVE